MKIPLYRPHIGKQEMGAISRVLRSKILSRGQEVECFEREFAKFAKKKYAIAVNGGTSGLHLAIRAIGWKKGDEIITTPFSYIASSTVLLIEGITPIFVDIDARTLNIDPSKIEKKITPKTKGILLVHIFGLPVDFKAIKKIKEKYNLLVIEDACEAIGRPSEDFTVTRLGDATVYSFYENKLITSAGEGGMVVTNSLVFARKCKSMRDQGRSEKKDWLNHVVLGFNFRMTEIQAAFGRIQLGRISKVLKKRDKIAKTYNTLLKSIDKITLPRQELLAQRSWFQYFIIFRNNKTRRKVHNALWNEGISSSMDCFPPIYKFPMFRKYQGSGYATTERVSNTLLTLPMYCDLREKQIKKIVNIIKTTIGK